ncbi:hypothetical protein SteCoe_29549 [Stentor coeruleus]|uniref:Uncharacterized protein n=1 Tax=Stentor coeruleus TaxID=5963 RepID=A0A1R2B5T0_9CILI|nr:hypothetical protein SteCoe_29549 [Stentor coeruleus]
MENLKLAKLFMLSGLLVGLSIPTYVMYKQSVDADRRKKNIIVDHDRVMKKLQENPDLKFRNEPTFLPVGESTYQNMVSKNSKNSQRV